jgi:hypothetical protein
MSGGGESAHVHPDLGDDHGRGSGPDTRDLTQTRHRIDERGDHLPDHGLQLGDISAQRIDPGPAS